MGIEGLWPFLKKKGYEPSMRYQGSNPPESGPRRHVDIQGCLFHTIRQAYSSHSVDDANSIIEGKLTKFASPPNSVLYLDGSPAEEKKHTHKHRREARDKALTLAQKGVTQLKDRLDRKLHVRKQHFITVRKHMEKGFYWSLESRRAFAQYLRLKGWSVVECPTEADIAIAVRCRSGDIVISKDSDTLVYKSILTIWRPISRKRFLVYEIPDVLATLGISRTQLTVLGIVSRNDYNRNIPSLGSETNFSIVTTLNEADPRSMVQKYLVHEQVVLKNIKQETFDTSLKVFVLCVQTPVLEPLTLPSAQESLTYGSLQRDFKHLQEQVAENKREQKELQDAKKSEASGEKIRRHKSSQRFNRYRTIDRPASQDVQTPTKNDLETTASISALSNTRTLHQRPRYSFKKRTRCKQYEPPQNMVQYAWKPWKKVPESPLDLSANVFKKKMEKNRKGKKTTPKPVNASTGKSDLVRAMAWEHPMVTLNVGTVSANLKRALGESELAPEINKCLQDVVRLASDTKRKGQRLIGQFIESIFASRDPDSTDRDILRNICPCVSSKNKPEGGPHADDSDEEQADEDEQDEQDDEDDGPRHKDSAHMQFHTRLLQHLYSGSVISTNGAVGKRVKQFVDRAADLGLLQRNDNRAAIRTRMPYPATSLLRSVASQLFTEIKKQYRNGSIELEKKLQALKAKGLVSDGSRTEIDQCIPAIENFILLNQASKSYRKTVPLTGMEQPFVSFSERELATLFWQNDALRGKLEELVLVDFEDKNFIPSIIDLSEWLMRKAPGSLITEILSNIGRCEPRKGRRDFKNSTYVMSLDQMRDHIQSIRQDNFDPNTYKEKGYTLRGSLLTDGFRLQLTAFKMKELQSVRFRRLPHDVLPRQITSTIGGVNYFLTEIRNVVKAKQDVEDLWGCEPEQIKILGLDLGQACVLGASALIPKNRHDKRAGTNLASHDLASAPTPTPMPTTAPSPTPPNAPPAPATYYNLAVKQKAVCQPTFKHRRWMEEQKRVVPGDGIPSISDIETMLPPRRGEGASFVSHVAKLEQVQGRLDKFYNSNNRFKNHKWDAKKARETEYRLITDRLLKVVGGSIGRKRDEANKVVIGIGLGQFSSKSRLSSLHESFQSYFVQKVRV